MTTPYRCCQTLSRSLRRGHAYSHRGCHSSDAEGRAWLNATSAPAPCGRSTTLIRRFKSCIRSECIDIGGYRGEKLCTRCNACASSDVVNGSVRRSIQGLISGKVWPRVNEILADVHGLIKATLTFLAWGTFTVEILTLLLIFILYINLTKLISVRRQGSAVYNTSRRTFVRSRSRAVDVFLQFTFLVILSLLGIHLLQQLFHIVNQCCNNYLQAIIITITN